jgi:hypothetical protein
VLRIEALVLRIEALVLRIEVLVLRIEMLVLRIEAQEAALAFPSAARSWKTQGVAFLPLAGPFPFPLAGHILHSLKIPYSCYALQGLELAAQGHQSS